MLSKFHGYQLSKEFYRKCKTLSLPATLYDQLIRAAGSVAMNLAEGSGRRTKADQRRHYTIAYGSMLECRAILDLEAKADGDLEHLADRLSAILFKLSRKSID